MTQEQQETAAYDAAALQEKWRPVWERLEPFRAGLRESSPGVPAPKRYALTMFPYPSGDLHMGHAEVMALHDVIARYWWHQGYDVLNPIGWDSFGLPAENAAIKRNEHPAQFTYANIETQAESFKRYGVSFDWSTRLHTSDPEYYRWTQWLFLKFREWGLAYRKNSPVNWCPNDQTVLANEQVLADGTCERCGAVVTKKELTQWYFKITDYAQRLLDGIDQLEGSWPERVVHSQRNWIGRSEGAHVDFVLQLADGSQRTVTVFTTRPDTLSGATFMVIAADAALASEVVAPSRAGDLESYLEEVRKASDIDRLATDRPKTGVDLGITATNPLTGEQIPVWAADYVLADYGTGAIMAVPAHDERDREFAEVFGLPIVPVYDPEQPYDKAGQVAAAIEKLESAGTGERTVNFRLRDWLLSRQRFWGAPIPIIHCEACGEVAVPEDQLPVRLPDDVRGEELKPKGSSPLAAIEDWVNVACPQCGGPAKRDSDTMDTFVDSSWYYLRYVSPHLDTAPFDVEAMRAWGPIDQYVGGVEHAVLHLLYSRFFTKVLHDHGYLDFEEPFSRLMSQGVVINQGKKMSKSLGNGVNLGEQLDAYGVDAVRLTLVFASPPEDNIDWADVSPAGSLRFLQRAWRLAGEVTSEPGVSFAGGDVALRRVTHKTLHEVEHLMETYRFNVVVARTMELVNATRKAIDNEQVGPADPAVREATEAVAILLSLVAPYTAEEMWERLGRNPDQTGTVARAGWPVVDEALLVEDTVTAVVQVAGKVRARLEVSPAVSEADLEAAALADPTIAALLDGATPRKVILRAPKLVNIVP
ncbi:leucine--tRNA ligase [Nocardioides sp. BP30]|uniref:leucine--tRNA ligase n=1 Tax=Nocardioides sp. BP30 TaxID=3036374 RepID=UPI002468A47F|nr:leucine--tRNA ligase [Nocardioides sp. BP30]WGL51156.1 leucine--tRNA ligase [Nocardioides sp. BP30]